MITPDRIGKILDNVNNVDDLERVTGYLKIKASIALVVPLWDRLEELYMMDAISEVDYDRFSQRMEFYFTFHQL